VRRLVTRRTQAHHPPSGTDFILGRGLNHGVVVVDDGAPARFLCVTCRRHVDMCMKIGVLNEEVVM
jgi:hypothetical protein